MSASPIRQLPSSTEPAGAETRPRIVERKLRLEDVLRDADLQVRAERSQETVDDYTEKLRQGVTLPAPVVFHDGARYWLADGHHTHEARLAIGLDEAVYAVRPGTRRDALMYALGANQAHGLRLTNADKRRKITLALADDEWRAWSDSRLAELCGVSDRFVGTLRNELGATSPQRTGGDGRTTNTANVGHTRAIKTLGRRTPKRSESSEPTTTGAATPKRSESAEAGTGTNPGAAEAPTPTWSAAPSLTRASEGAAPSAVTTAAAIDQNVASYEALPAHAQLAYLRRINATPTAPKPFNEDAWLARLWALAPPAARNIVRDVYPEWVAANVTPEGVVLKPRTRSRQE